MSILVILVLWHSLSSNWMLPSLLRKQGTVLCEFTWLTGWPPWRAAKISWFGKQCVFFLVLGKGLPVPCGIYVWAKAEGGFRGPWRICVSSWSSGGGRLGPGERKSELITWVKCVKCSYCMICMIIILLTIYWKWTRGLNAILQPGTYICQVGVLLGPEQLHWGCWVLYNKPEETFRKVRVQRFGFMIFKGIQRNLCRLVCVCWYSVWTLALVNKVKTFLYSIHQSWT